MFKGIMLVAMLFSLGACASSSQVEMSPSEQVAAMVCKTGPSANDILNSDIASVTDIGIFVNKVLRGEVAKSFLDATGAASFDADIVVILSAKKYLASTDASHVVVVKNGCAIGDKFMPNQQIMSLLGLTSM